MRMREEGRGVSALTTPAFPAVDNAQRVTNDGGGAETVIER